MHPESSAVRRLSTARTLVVGTLAMGTLDIFWAIGNAEAGVQKLRRDLETGEWERRYAELLTLDEYDAGYRLVVAN